MLHAIRNLWALLPGSHRRRALLLVLLMSGAALLEMVSIGALLPIIRVMQEPDLLTQNAVLARLMALMGNPPERLFFVYLLVLLLAFFLVKNISLYFLAQFQYRFVSGAQALLSTKLLSSYLHRPYTFHLQVNTANLIRDVTIEVVNVLNQIMIPLVIWTTECLVVLALFGLIVSIDPLAALFSFSLGGGVIFALYLVMRGPLARSGMQIQIDSGKMIQYAQEALGGIKELKILGREQFFKDAFSKHVLRYTRSVKDVMVFNAIPRLVLDMLVIAVFVGILLILMSTGRAEEALPLMTIYAASAFRLLPGMNRIMGAMNAIRVGKASLGLVADRLGADARHEPAPGPRGEHRRFAERITLDNVSFRYDAGRASAVEHVTLEIERGEMVGFMGPSGSGKTTLIDIILGLLNPTGGSVHVDGRDIHVNLSAWQNQIGYIPQTIYLTDDTIRRNIALGVADEEIADEKIWAALEAAQLAEFVRTLPDGLDTHVGERGARLSGGQRQRIGIARAMYYEPEILVLDEATSALDNETERRMMEAINALRGRRTILIIAHRTSTLESCDRIFVLNRGRLEKVVDQAVPQA